MRWLSHEKIEYEASVFYLGKTENGVMKKRWEVPDSKIVGRTASDYAPFAEAGALPYSSILFANNATRAILSALALDMQGEDRLRAQDMKVEPEEDGTAGRTVLPDGTGFEFLDLFCLAKDLHVQAFFSRARTESLTHRDTTASLLFVESGIKSVWMAPPGASQYHEQVDNFLLFDPHSAPMPNDHELAGVWKHFVLSSGQILHVPRGWWHNIVSTEGTLAFGIKCKPRMMTPYTFVLIALPTLCFVRSWASRALLIAVTLFFTAAVMTYKG